MSDWRRHVKGVAVAAVAWVVAVNAAYLLWVRRIGQVGQPYTPKLGDRVRAGQIIGHVHGSGFSHPCVGFNQPDSSTRH